MASHNVPLYFLCFALLAISQSTLALSENYIIHMDSSAMPKTFSDKHSWYLSTLATISETTTTDESPSSSKHIYTYTHVMNGFSASLTPSQLEALKGTPGYILAIKDLPVKKDTTHTNEFLGLNPKFGAWPASKYGRDIIIGVVDTGVWPESKSYNDEGMSEIPVRWKGTCESDPQFDSSMCNKKLIGAHYFNKGLIAQLPKNVTISMNSTRDSEGHGTHTSSTAAGNYVKDASYYNYAPGTAVGVAPRAHVAMYKALWEYGSFTSDVIAAIDQAISDGVDVLSMSFGRDGVPLYDDAIALATFAAIEKGIFVSTSAGNEGPYIATLHNGIPWVLTVAAGTIDREFRGVLGLGNGLKVLGSALHTGDYKSTQNPLVFMDECKDSIELNKTGDKFVVCEDKNETLYDQIHNVRKANVTGGIFLSNSTDVKFFIKTSFPAIFMRLEDGETIKDYIKTNKEPKASLEFGITNLGTKPQPSVTDYSSRGPSQSCPFVLKPDIMAPGDMVLAAWPSNIPVSIGMSKRYFNNFNILSGTSMACPHAAGVGALLKSVHPEWSPAAIRSAMMTTADVTDNTQRPIADSGDDFKTASPIAMGAGQVNPNKALDPGLIYDVGVNDYVNLLCGMGFTAKQIRAITRSSATNCSAPSLDLNYPSFIAFFNVNDTKSDTTIVQEFKRTVTNVGEGMSIYIAKVPTLDGLKVSVTPDKLVFKEKYEKQSYKLSIEGPKLMKQEQVFGFLSWEEVGGKHVVKSPVVATNIDSDITG
ncbi:subtilisin-like protease SBT3 [Tripterygium wilfordii]|uniref:subtilisin-like protease SBT3 n=1 Tax=Tripterygium wilfordii TaxID=458696 RepID=UPI0018F8450A|nr:subtilisin-like protease SBT3 [Tripterygium wilfordii]